MTAYTMPRLETEAAPCALCLAEPSRALGDIWVDGQLLGRVVECGTCGLRFMSPRPTQEQRNWLYEKEYDSSLPGEHGDTRFASVHEDQDQGRVRFARYLDCLGAARSAASGGRPRLLDVGAGTGQLMELARDRGWDVYAVEASDDACQLLREQFGTESVIGRDLADLRDGARSYDAIIMAHVIEHLPAPVATLRTVKRLIAPGGKLLVATPNESSLYERLWQVRQRWRGGGAANRYVNITWHGGRWRRTPRLSDERGMAEFQILTTEHLFFFTRKTLGHALKQAGFTRLHWARGSVTPGNSRLGRLLRNGPSNRALFHLGLESELVAIAEASEAS